MYPEKSNQNKKIIIGLGVAVLVVLAFMVGRLTSPATQTDTRSNAADLQKAQQQLNNANQQLQQSKATDDAKQLTDSNVQEVEKVMQDMATPTTLPDLNQAEFE